MIEIRLTAGTVSEMRKELFALLNPTIGVSGSVKPAAPAPATVTQPGESVSGTTILSGSTTVADTITTPSDENPTDISAATPTLPTANPVKRGRGRPRKVVVSPTPTNPPPNAAEPVDDDPDMGNESVGGISATAPAEPISDAASSTFSEPATVADESVNDEMPLVTDVELQRYCARLAQHFGDASAVFALAAPFVPEGQPPRPSKILDNDQRWAFIRRAEQESGISYHG